MSSIFLVKNRRPSLSCALHATLPFESSPLPYFLPSQNYSRNFDSLPIPNPKNPKTMSVIGIDIGNSTSVVAAVKHRGIDVLLNSESTRENPTSVCFSEKQRLISSPTTNPNPRSTIYHIKRLLGIPFNQADVASLPFVTSPDPTTGQILVHLDYCNETKTFTFVQLLGMLLAHLKQLAEKNLEADVSDCVVGIPVYFTNLQRQLYLDAAKIAGLKILRLVHDTTAVAVGYGIYKNDITEKMNVCFVDVGQCDTQVSVVSFEKDGMRVLSTSFDANLGGGDFDEVLFRHFAEEFKEKYHIDVYSNVRASTRLRVACEKLKRVLSANAEAPINIECLMDEKDVKGFIKREEFESLSSDLLERVLIPVKKAVNDAGIGMETINSIELVGSGSRVPAIMKVLAGFFGKEPSRTLNASECVARGCALQGAMLSPVFRVREYEVQDSFPFSIGFTLDEGLISTLSSKVIFRRGQPFPSVKILTLHRATAFRLEAFYADESELPPGTPLKISCITIGPFQASESEKHKVKVKLRLNLHGIISVESATLIEDQKNESILRDTDQTDMDIQHESAPNMHFDPGTKISSRRHEIPVREILYGGMSKVELSQAQEQEKQLANQDKLMEQTKERKNALEAYVYEVRNKLFERYRSFASDSEREGISTSLQQTEDWLYEDGDDESVDVYISKLEDLKKIVEPIEKRFRDEDARGQARRELLNCIAEYRKAAKSLPANEQDAVINECNQAEQWLTEKFQQQDSVPKTTDPVIWSHDIKKRIEVLNSICSKYMKT